MTSDEPRSSERWVHLWITVGASLIAAAIGSGVGGWLSYRAAQSAATSASQQSQVEFTRTQRQSSYLTVSSQVAYLKAQFDAAQYDAVPYGVTLNGEFKNLHLTISRGTRVYVDMAKQEGSLSSVRDGVMNLVRDGGVLNVVASRPVSRQYSGLIRVTTNRMDNLYNLQEIEKQSGTYTQERVNAIASYLRADAKFKAVLDSQQSAFGRAAKHDLGIR